MQPVTKLSIVQAHMAAGDFRKALAIAAKFPQLGTHENAIRLGHEAWVHPEFYKQLGKDIEQLRRAGAEALVQKYAPKPKKTAPATPKA